jgi:VanZ family protein
MPTPHRLPLPVKVFILSVCLGTLAWMSLTPTRELPTVNMWDKSEHFIAYAVLATVCLTLFPGRLARIVAGCIGFGVAIEILQAIMGFGRDGDWRDALANSIGVLLAVGVERLARWLARRVAPA